MVVDHVHVDLDAGVVECLHHCLELGGGAACRLVVSVMPIWCEVVFGHVTPVVLVRVRIRHDVVRVVLRFLQGQKFDGGDAEAGERWRLESGALIGAAIGCRDAGVLLGQAAHIDFVDHVVLLRSRGLGAGALCTWCQHDAFRCIRATVGISVAGARGKDVGILV